MKNITIVIGFLFNKMKRIINFEYFIRLIIRKIFRIDYPVYFVEQYGITMEVFFIRFYRARNMGKIFIGVGLTR